MLIFHSAASLIRSPTFDVITFSLFHYHLYNKGTKKRYIQFSMEFLESKWYHFV